MQVASAVFSGTGTPFERTDINCLVATIQDVDRAGAMARQVFAAVCMQRALEVGSALISTFPSSPICRFRMQTRRCAKLSQMNML